jgi:hypothetical protein
MFSPSGKHVDELAYGLSDQFCALLVEQPHRTNSTLRNDCRPASSLDGKLALEVPAPQPGDF